MSDTNKMKVISSAILISLILPFHTVKAAEINVSSSIKAVTVYPGSAKVTRNTTLTLLAGDNEVVINNLPLNLNENSLRISGEGEGNISLGSVELSRDIQASFVLEQERSIRKKINEVRESRKVIEDSISRNKAQLEYIKRMALGNAYSTQQSQQGAQQTHQVQTNGYINLPIEQWQQAWDTLNQATENVQLKIRVANKSLTESNKKLNQLNRELQQIATNQRENRSASLKINADVKTELTLSISYQIQGARWEPVYDFDLDTSTGDIQLKTLAQISQRTGENWSDVDVTLSTLRPNSGTQLPSLNPWVLDFLPEMVAYQNEISFDMAESQAGQVMEAPSPKMARRMSKAAAPMKQQQSRLITTDFSAEYIVPSKVDLDSGSNKRRFALNTQQISASIKLASSPRFDPRVMILATTKYEDETPLLAGSISLYRNGNFVGNSFLAQKLSGEDIKLSFGEDDKVKINFIPDPDKKRKDGLLFGKKKVVERHYKVSLTSNHDKPYLISLSDVLPVSADEKITVKRLGAAPTSIDLDDKKGVVSWDMTLEPKSQSKLKYGYSVSYPEDKVIPQL